MEETFFNGAVVVDANQLQGEREYLGKTKEGNYFRFNVPDNLFEALESSGDKYIDEEFTRATADFTLLASLGANDLFDALRKCNPAEFLMSINVCGSYHLALNSDYTKEELAIRFNLEKMSKKIIAVFEIFTKKYITDLGNAVMVGLPQPSEIKS